MWIKHQQKLEIFWKLYLCDLKKKKRWRISLWLLNHLRLLSQQTLVYSSSSKELLLQSHWESWPPTSRFLFKELKQMQTDLQGNCIQSKAIIQLRKEYAAKSDIRPHEWRLHLMACRRSLFTKGYSGGDSLFWLTGLDMLLLPACVPSHYPSYFGAIRIYTGIRW